MSEQRAHFLRKALIGSCTLVALILLVAFYSTVHGAVDRAARLRLSANDATAPGAAATLQRPSARSAALLARVGG